MGDVIYMQAWKAKRLFEGITGQQLPGTGPSKRIYFAGFSADLILIEKLEGMVKTQKEILHTSRHVHVREEAAIKIGELKIQLARLRNKQRNKDG